MAALEPDALRLQLRSLRRDEPPSRDLWPGIAARLNEPQAVLAPAGRPVEPTRSRSRSRSRRWREWAAAGLAATFLLAVGLGQRPTPAPPLQVPPADSIETAAATRAPLLPPTLVQREAEGLSREYQAALAELAQAPATPAVQPAIDEIDRSASLIRSALMQDPGSLLLLDQLRRTYALRLELTQRAIHT